MASVHLTNEEWQQVLSIIAGAPWNVANPLLMKIGEQLRVQQPGAVQGGPERIKTNAQRPDASSG
jgi:hypothetical protein